MTDTAPEFERDRLRGFLECIVEECLKPLDQYKGGYTQKNARIQVMAEAALGPIPIKATDL